MAERIGKFLLEIKLEYYKEEVHDFSVEIKREGSQYRLATRAEANEVTVQIAPIQKKYIGAIIFAHEKGIPQRWIQWDLLLFCEGKFATIHVLHSAIQTRILYMT